MRGVVVLLSHQGFNIAGVGSRLGDQLVDLLREPQIRSILGFLGIVGRELSDLTSQLGILVDLGIHHLHQRVHLV